jgi:hypothetical protein
VTPIGSLVSAAVNCIVWPVPIAAVCGLTATPMGCVVNGELPQPPVKAATGQRTHKKREEPYKDTTRLIFGLFVLPAFKDLLLAGNPPYSYHEIREMLLATLRARPRISRCERQERVSLPLVGIPDKLK